MTQFVSVYLYLISYNFFFVSTQMTSLDTSIRQFLLPYAAVLNPYFYKNDFVVDYVQTVSFVSVPIFVYFMHSTQQWLNLTLLYGILCAGMWLFIRTYLPIVTTPNIHKDGIKNQYALVTGGNGGIGLAIAEELASYGYHLFLVARDLKRLEEIQTTLLKKYNNKIKVQICSKDLTFPQAPQEIFEQTNKLEAPVTVLVNNAGFGTHGAFIDSTYESQVDQVQLNVTSLVALTHLFLKRFKINKMGMILHVASTAAFQPGPLMATYFATKSFVLNFSLALSYELRHTNIVNSVICPGATHSDFATRSGNGQSFLFKKAPVDTPQDVAKLALHGLLRGDRLIIHSKFQPARLLSRLFPNSLVIWVSNKIMSVV